MKKRALHILFTTTIVLLGLPLFLGVLSGGRDGIKALNGVTIAQHIPPFDIQNWRNMEFQIGASKYINQNFSFRPFFIRLYNQVEYSVFDKMANKNIIKGKDEYLFKSRFIKSYYGRDFKGTKRIDDQVQKLIAVDSVLKSNGVHLIVALAPGKVSVYPEKIPDYLVQSTNEHTNFKVYRKKLKESGITIFDINKYFMDIKPNFDRDLFPKGGAHWSHDAALIALDSLLGLIELETGEVRNRIQITGLKKTQIPEGSDDDIVRVSNFLFDNLNTDYYYPEFHFENIHPTKGKLIAISDSFFWIFFESGLDNSFENVKYWYYFMDVFPESYKSPKKVKDINISKELLEADVVLLMASTQPIKNLGWGFIDQAYDLLLKDFDKEITSKKLLLK